MKTKVLVPLYVLCISLALMISIGVITDDSGADESIVYTSPDGCLYIIDNNEATLIDTMNYTGGDELNVPATIEVDSTTYPVVKIGSAAISVSDLRCVRTGDNVHTIDDYNFNYCHELDEIHFGAGLRDIGKMCFEDCEKLTSSSFDVSSSPAFTIEDNGSLYMNNSVLVKHLDPIIGTHTVTKKITYIRPEAFGDQKDMTRINLPESVMVMDAGCFRGCTSLEGVDCGIRLNTLPNNLNIIGADAFLDCTSLRNLVFPDMLQIISSCAFSHCDSLTSVYIPANVTYIGPGAFSSCNSLTEILVDDGSETYHSDDGILYKKMRSYETYCLHQYPIGKQVSGGALDLSDKNIRVISEMAFTSENPNVPLFKLVLPETLENIETYAFYRCNNLTSINIPGNVSMIDTNTFHECLALEKVDVGYGVATIGPMAFYGCGSLSDIKLPQSVTLIGYSAFEGCTSLRNFVLPDSKVTMEGYVFYECQNIGSITISNSETVLKDESLFISFNEGSDITIHVPNGYVIPDNAMDMNMHYIIEEEGIRPYPYENWIVIAIAVILMGEILHFIRRV